MSSSRRPNLPDFDAPAPAPRAPGPSPPTVMVMVAASSSGRVAHGVLMVVAGPLFGLGKPTDAPDDQYNCDQRPDDDACDFSAIERRTPGDAVVGDRDSDCRWICRDGGCLDERCLGCRNKDSGWESGLRAHDDNGGGLAWFWDERRHCCGLL